MIEAVIVIPILISLVALVYAGVASLQTRIELRGVILNAGRSAAFGTQSGPTSCETIFDQELGAGLLDKGMTLSEANATEVLLKNTTDAALPATPLLKTVTFSVSVRACTLCPWSVHSSLPFILENFDGDESAVFCGTGWPKT